MLFGHSMGGAVAVAFADRHPDRTLGIAYRDGIATPAWRERHGIVARSLGALSPDLAGFTDLMAASVLDWPDLLVGRRLTSTFRRLGPDARHNVRSLSGVMAVGSLLMSLDLRGELARVVRHGIPLLPVWGCFDRVASAATARESRAHRRGRGLGAGRAFLDAPPAQGAGRRAGAPRPGPALRGPGAAPPTAPRGAVPTGRRPGGVGRRLSHRSTGSAGRHPDSLRHPAPNGRRPARR